MMGAIPFLKISSSPIKTPRKNELSAENFPGL